MNYYNENDPKAAAWLMELISQRVIADGVVDSRPIQDVTAEDLADYTQCHFFAGIGGWAYALQLAGWPSDARVWTGSCPCQPFSMAGKQKGFDDDRHLWPYFFQLISVNQPPTIFGEQVASKAGKSWLDLVSADLEGEGYAIGSADLAAASVGAPHNRQRLYWVGHADHERSQGRRIGRDRTDQRATRETGVVSGMEHATGVGLVGRRQRHGSGEESQRRDAAIRSGLREQAPERRAVEWRDADWIDCADGKARPVEPGTFPLAHGVPARVGRLRGYGNAIVPEVAQVFVEAYMDVVGGVE